MVDQVNDIPIMNMDFIDIDCRDGETSAGEEISSVADLG
jgi:hypothetical protein